MAQSSSAPERVIGNDTLGIDTVQREREREVEKEREETPTIVLFPGGEKKAAEIRPEPL